MNTGTRVRVVILINELLRGGAQRIVLDLVKHIDPVQFEVSVLCLKDPVGIAGNEPNLLSEVEALGITVHSLEGGRKFTLTEGLALYRYLRTLRPDILHTFLPYAGTLGRVVGRLTGVRAIVSTQCNLPVAYTKRVYWLDRVTLPLAHVWLAAAEGIEYSYAGSSVPFSLNAWNTYRRHFTVVAGVDLPSFDLRVKNTDREATRALLDIPEESVLVLMIARLVSWKGHTDLVKSLTYLPEHVYLALVGWGPMEQELRDTAEESGLTARVRFLGARNDIPELLAATDVYAQTHRIMEDGSTWKGPNTSQMEACAARIPSVSTSVPLIETLIEDTITGLLAHPNDPEDIARAIRQQIEDPASARAMAEKARARVEDRYQVSSMGKIHTELYAMLAKYHA